MAHFPKVLETIEDLNPHQIEWLLNRAKEFKTRIKNNTLAQDPFFQNPPNIVSCTFFEEHSTRTKLSFMRALQLLKAQNLNFDSGSSSLKKGESIRETFLTIKSMGVNLCIYRSPSSHALSSFKQNPPFKLINAGDGMNQHPTQALLDLFTMLELEQTLENKQVTIIGDCRHSRVTHSLIRLLPQYGAKVLLIGPPEFLMETSEFPGVQSNTCLTDALTSSDILYLLRIQSERHTQNFELDNYVQNYGITDALLSSLSKIPAIYSPGPANVGVEIDDQTIQGPHFRGHIQVENGVYMRMAIIQAMMKDQ